MKRRYVSLGKKKLGLGKFRSRGLKSCSSRVQLHLLKTNEELNEPLTLGLYRPLDTSEMIHLLLTDFFEVIQPFVNTSLS